MKRFVLKRIIENKFYRKVRSRLKSKIKNGSRLNNRLKVKYHLSKFKSDVHYGGLSTIEDWLELSIPPIFCLIDNHDETMKFLSKTESELKQNKPKNIHFDHTDTIKIGLTASYLFDRMIKKHREYWLKKGILIQHQGLFSKEKEVNNFLVSIGLLDELSVPKGHITSINVDYDYKEKYETFKFHGSSKEVYSKSNAATELVKYFRKCFNYNHLDLTEKARGYLADSFGEILGNAEEHSGEQITKWDVLGFYNKSTSYCSFAIINYGKSIYESLSNASSTALSVLKEIEIIVESNKSILNKSKKIFNSELVEPIWNVMALQDGISSKRTLSGKSSTRGQGLMDVLDFIERVTTKDDPRNVVLLSGYSKIIIDYSYKIQKMQVGKQGEMRRFIIFNKENNLHKLSDSDKVIVLKNKFEGTIITGKFKINEKYLVSKIRRNSHE
jgi:hypothetical protein